MTFYLLDSTTISFPKDYFPLLGPLFIILTFSIDRWWATRIRRREQQQTWYLKTMVEPNIEKIEAFYDLTFQIFLEAVEKLNKIANINIGLYGNTQALFNSKFQEAKRKFEIQFVLLLENGYENLSGNLTTIIQELEDNFVTSLDNLNSQNDLSEQFRSHIAFSKSSFYHTLYSPLLLPRPRRA